MCIRDRLDAKPVQLRPQRLERLLRVEEESTAPDPYERPAHPFQFALARRVRVRVLLGVERVAIAFHRQPARAALHHQVDAVATGRVLGADPVTPGAQGKENALFEETVERRVRFVRRDLSQARSILGLGRPREPVQIGTPQIGFTQLGETEAVEEPHLVTGPGGRHVDVLLIQGAAERADAARTVRAGQRRDRTDEDDVTLVALELLGIADAQPPPLPLVQRKVAEQILDQEFLRGAEQRDDTHRAPRVRGIPDTPEHGLDQPLRFRPVDLLLAAALHVPVGHVHGPQRYQPVGTVLTQRLQPAAVAELVGETDDLRHAAEVLAQHQAASAPGESGGYVEEAGGRCEKVPAEVRQPAEQPALEQEQLLVVDADVGGADLLVVTHHDDLRAEPGKQQGLRP